MDNFPGYLLLSLRFLLAVSLYVFLGWSVWVVWKELKHTAQTISSKQIPPIYLTLDPAAGKPIAYTRSEIIIGRSPISDLHIADETVSSRHGQLYYKHNQWWYEDLGSSNGSFINELDVNAPTVLTDGDQLRLGKITMVVTFM